MVTDLVVVRKPFNYKKLIIILISILVIALVLGAVFFVGVAFGGFLSPKQASMEYENPLLQIIVGLEEQGISVNETEIIEQAEIEFDYNYINYVLYAMSAWKLHNPPFSGDTPKLKVIVDDEIYYSEVVDTEINTYLDDIGEEDVEIIISKGEVIQAMLAEDMSVYMKESVAEGETKIDLIAGSLTLASKGYLQMYKDITGEELEIS